MFIKKRITGSKSKYRAVLVIPITWDIIVQSRGEYINQDNLIAIEMKKSSNTKAEKDKDRERLIALTEDFL